MIAALTRSAQASRDRDGNAPTQTTTMGGQPRARPERSSVLVPGAKIGLPGRKMSVGSRAQNMGRGRNLSKAQKDAWNRYWAAGPFRKTAGLDEKDFNVYAGRAGDAMDFKKRARAFQRRKNEQERCSRAAERRGLRARRRYLQLTARHQGSSGGGGKPLTERELDAMTSLRKRIVAAGEDCIRPVRNPFPWETRIRRLSTLGMNLGDAAQRQRHAAPRPMGTTVGDAPGRGTAFETSFFFSVPGHAAGDRSGPRTTASAQATPL